MSELSLVVYVHMSEYVKIYLLTKYLKSLLWGVAVRLSYI